MDTVLWFCPSLPTETLKWLSSLPILMQESFWWWQCSDRYIMSLSSNLHTPFPPFSPSLISRTVSVDVKHHVYWWPGTLQASLSGTFVQKKDAVNECLEFGGRGGRVPTNSSSQTQSAWKEGRGATWSRSIAPPCWPHPASTAHYVHYDWPTQRTSSWERGGGAGLAER